MRQTSIRRTPFLWLLYFVLGGRINLQQRRASLDLDIGYRHHLADPSRKRSHDLHLHFHRFEDGQAISGRNHVTRLDCNGNYHRWGRSIYYASLVVLHRMRDTIYFYAIT